MTRWRAAGIHLLLSALLGVCVLALLFFVWYPGPLFRATGGEKLLLLIVGIDIVAGPLLTLCVYDAKKRLMKLEPAVDDLSGASSPGECALTHAPGRALTVCYTRSRCEADGAPLERFDCTPAGSETASSIF